jgi:hypothetical protein
MWTVRRKKTAYVRNVTWHGLACSMSHMNKTVTNNRSITWKLVSRHIHVVESLPTNKSIAFYCMTITDETSFYSFLWIFNPITTYSKKQGTRIRVENKSKKKTCRTSCTTMTDKKKTRMILRFMTLFQLLMITCAHDDERGHVDIRCPRTWNGHVAVRLTSNFSMLEWYHWLELSIEEQWRSQSNHPIDVFLYDVRHARRIWMLNMIVLQCARIDRLTSNRNE